MIAPAGLRIAIDVGGTFTDVLALRADGSLARLKVATTPQAPERSALRALAAMLTAEDVPGASIELIAHASTIATNALLGQLALDLPRVAFITTEGFRDVLEIGRQNRSAIYDLAVRRPRPLARRADRLTVRERREYDGRVSTALDLAGVERAIDAIAARGITTVAIGLLHAYVDDAHEAAIAARIAARLPQVAISRSADIVREFREYERFSTAVVNAALMPIVGAYLAALEAGVREAGVVAPIFVMRSDGGMAAAAVAAQRPASIIESGPAGGVIAAAYLARTAGIARLLSFDMGGTTAKAGAIVDGIAEVAHEFEAAGTTHSGRAQKGSGYPVRFPFIDLAEVSAGGGTIAWLDAAQTLRVGPLSAGADPGPAAYGLGSQPTVTDANLVLGRLGAETLLGGEFRVDAARAHGAIATVAAATGGDVVAAAAGIVDLIDAEMAKVLRIVSVERGHDPRDFALLAFGGGGPLHACAVARDIGIRTVLVPPLPGLFSAYGLLAADVRVTFTQSLVAPLDDAVWRSLDDVFATLDARAADALGAQQVAAGARVLVREVDLRYAGQSFELTVPAGTSRASAVAAFHSRHAQRYGFAAPEETVQLVTVRTIGHGTTRKPPMPRSEPRTAGACAPNSTREMWHAEAFVPTAVYRRADLPAGVAFDGPAVVEQYDTTTYVAPGWSAQLDAFGTIVLSDRSG